MAIVVVMVMAFVGGYWYYSPYLVMKSLRDAAQRKDADAFNERVDYPKVREGLKGQIAAMMAEEAASSNDGFAAFGAMLGMFLANQMVDALVRPESVMRAMQSGEMRPDQSSAHPDTQAASDKKPVEWTLERKTVDKVVAYRYEPGREVGKDFSVVLERNGFSDWKLTEIRINKVF